MRLETDWKSDAVNASPGPNPRSTPPASKIQNPASPHPSNTPVMINDKRDWLLRRKTLNIPRLADRPGKSSVLPRQINASNSGITKNPNPPSTTSTMIVQTAPALPERDSMLSD